MCDYSLSVTESRPADVGERLVVHRFSNGVKGFVSEPDLCNIPLAETGHWSKILDWFSYKKDPCAICLESGTRMVLRDLPDALRSDLKLEQDEEVTVGGSSGVYRDAVKFQVGSEVLIQWLPAGLVADVLSVASAREPEHETISSLYPDIVPVRKR